MCMKELFYIILFIRGMITEKYLRKILKRG